MLREDGPYRCERVIKFAEEEIESVSPLMAIRTAWAAVEDVSTHKDILVLWTDPGAGIIVPRRAVGDEREERRFVQFVKAQIAGRKELDRI